MPDMLVKLYDLKDNTPLYQKLEVEGIRIIRPMTPNKTKVLDWVKEVFPGGWSDELSAAFTRFPISCFIAYDENEKKILGFAGYDCTYRNCFGPTGVDPAARGKGIATKLYRHVADFAKANGCYNVTLNVWAGNDGALAFYQKMGMQPQKTKLEAIVGDL